MIANPPQASSWRKCSGGAKLAWTIRSVILLRDKTMRNSFYRGIAFVPPVVTCMILSLSLPSFFICHNRLSFSSTPASPLSTPCLENKKTFSQLPFPMQLNNFSFLPPWTRSILQILLSTEGMAEAMMTWLWRLSHRYAAYCQTKF